MGGRVASIRQPIQDESTRLLRAGLDVEHTLYDPRRDRSVGDVRTPLKLEKRTCAHNLLDSFESIVQEVSQGHQDRCEQFTN